MNDRLCLICDTNYEHSHFTWEIRDVLEQNFKQNDILKKKLDLVIEDLESIKKQIIDQNDPTPLEVFRWASELLKELKGE